MDKPPPTFNGFHVKPCAHPMASVVDHPTEPGKSICRGCGQVGTVMRQVGPMLLPKTDFS